MASQNGFSIPLVDDVAGTSKSVNGISLPLIDDIANTPKSMNGFSIQLVQYCLRVVDQNLNPVENAIVTLSDGAPSEEYISDADGIVYVFIKSSTATAQKAGFGDGVLVYDFEGQEEVCLDVQLTSVTGLATQLESQTLPPLQTILKNDFCYCAVECNYIELAFAEVGGEAYKNDKASFLFQKLVSSDTIEYELYKAGSKIADLNDNTYGVLYDGFTEKPLYKGFILDWEKVLNGLGAGKYQVKVQRDILGNSDTVESRLFHLLPYSDEYADKTVKLEGVQTGNLISSTLDYTDLLPDGWPIYVRVRGILYKVNPEFVENNTKDSDYRKEQIQDGLNRNFQLEMEQVPAEVANLFLDGPISLANNIKATDYNLFNTEIFRDLELYMSEPQYEPLRNQRLQDVNILFTDKNQNILKRN